jgi:hypothetical protein
MNKHIIARQIRQLDELFKAAESIEDEFMQTHFAKYLCVRTSGLFENYIKSQVGDYVDKSSAQPTANYVKSNLRNFTNVEYKKLKRFLSFFSEEWTQKLEAELNENMMRALNDVVSNRNSIAHGNPDNITLRNLKEHYANIKIIMHVLDSIIKK